jgi:hypothetical protein
VGKVGSGVGVRAQFASEDQADSLGGKLFTQQWQCTQEGLEVRAVVVMIDEEAKGAVTTSCP